jgi:flagellar biosynthesis protein FliR
VALVMGEVLAGLVLMAIAAPSMGEGITAAIQRGLTMARQIALGG